MKNIFDNVDSANMRLAGAIVLYDGHPHLCKVRDGDLTHRHTTRVSIIRLDKINRNPVYTQVEYTDPKFAVGFPEIGYVNTKSGALYCRSFPARSQKWGWTVGSITVDYGNEVDRIGDALLYSKNMYRTMMGIYPDIPKVLLELADGKQSMAFDREFAIVKRNKILELQFNCDRIGTVSKVGTCTLDKDYEGIEYISKLLMGIVHDKGGRIENP